VLADRVVAERVGDLREAARVVVGECSAAAIEIDLQIYQLTWQDLSILGLPVASLQADYMHALRELNLPKDYPSLTD
jgi:hypothetical protein